MESLQNFEAAQQMMRNMSPEQIEQMQRMVSNMTPEQRENMQRMAAGMGMGAGGAAPAASPAGAGTYTYNAAMMLKNEGNQLHKAGDFGSALAKYTRARENLASHTTPQALELRSQCTLNAAMCHLRLSEYDACIRLCSEVLGATVTPQQGNAHIPDRAGGPNLKAVYRRGQAYLGLAKYPEAVRDLEQALALCPAADAAQRELITAKVSEARLGLGDGQPAPPEPAPGAAASTRRNGNSVVIEEVFDDEPAVGASSGAAAAAVPAPTGHPTTWTPAQRDAYMKESMRDPEQVRKMAEAMEGMTDEQYAEMARRAGMPAVDKGMAQQAAQMMKQMTPEQLQSMAAIASKHGAANPSAAASAGSRAPAPTPATPGAASSALPSDLSQEQVSMAANMMANMSEAEMQEVMRAASASGMVPEGMNVTPEMLKASSEMLKNMSPAELERMKQMASAQAPATGGGTAGTQAPAGATGAPGTPGSGGAPDMNAMMKDPAAMEQAMAMMRNMDEDQLTQMLKMSQPGMTDEQAQRAARQMKSMDEKSMKMMMGLAQKFQSTSQALSGTVQWLKARPLLVLALVVLLIAIVLRLAGIM